MARIRDGAEVGSAASIYDVGTYARITDFDPLDNGLLGITPLAKSVFESMKPLRSTSCWSQPRFPP